jgi:hypothetical protein
VEFGVIQLEGAIDRIRYLAMRVGVRSLIKNWLFFFGATAPIWVLAYLHEILRFTLVY